MFDLIKNHLTNGCSYSMKAPISNLKPYVIWIWVLDNHGIRLQLIFDWFPDYHSVDKFTFMLLNFMSKSRTSTMERRAEEVTVETPLDVSTVSTLLSPLGYGLLSLWMLAVTLLSLLSNSLVIVVMLRNRQLYLPTNVLILGLAVSDLLLTLCGSAVGTVTNYYGQFFMGRELCVFQGFSVNYFGEWLHLDYIRAWWCTRWLELQQTLNCRISFLRAWILYGINDIYSCSVTAFSWSPSQWIWCLSQEHWVQGRNKPSTGNPSIAGHQAHTRAF